MVVWHGALHGFTGSYCVLRCLQEIVTAKFMTQPPSGLCTFKGYNVPTHLQQAIYMQI